MTEIIEPVSARIDQQQLAQQLVETARAEGVELVGPGGLLAGLTKTVLETALEAEMTEHLGYEAHEAAGRDGGNSRNGHRSKTVLTEVGPVEIDVPRDRDGSFEPRIVAKRQRRLSGVDELVISLSAKGLTTGEVQAHLAEVYGAEVSRQTISTITDKVVEGMAEWQNRPLDPVYPVVFIDAINVKIRDGKVANRPVYVALAVTCEGRREILGLGAGEARVGDRRAGRRGREVLAARAHRDQEPRCGRRADGRLRRPDRAPRTPSRRCGRRRSPKPHPSTMIEPGRSRWSPAPSRVGPMQTCHPRGPDADLSTRDGGGLRIGQREQRPRGGGAPR